MLRRLPHPRVIAGLLATLVVLGGGFLLLRDSGLVAVREVEVTGLTGPEAARLSRQLSDAARDMTTMNVDRAQLAAIVEPYSVVGGLTVTTDFPHGLRIDVRERTPIAEVRARGQRQLVDGNARVLRGAAARDVPVITLHAPIAGDRIVDRRTRRAIEALAVAPPALRSRVERAWWGKEGLTMTLEDGPSLRFGGTERIVAKWMSAARVLADGGSRGATYIDVRYPQRPAAGGLEDPALQGRPDAAPSATGPTGPVGATPTLNP